MEKILEKSKKYYVLGTINEDDGSCYYLKSLHYIGAYELVLDIEKATKAEKKWVIELLLENYKMDLKENALDFVILPVIVDYSLIKEIED